MPARWERVDFCFSYNFCSVIVVFLVTLKKHLFLPEEFCFFFSKGSVHELRFCCCCFCSASVEAMLSTPPIHLVIFQFCMLSLFSTHCYIYTHIWLDVRFCTYSFVYDPPLLCLLSASTPSNYFSGFDRVHSFTDKAADSTFLCVASFLLFLPHIYVCHYEYFTERAGCL